MCKVTINREYLKSVDGITKLLLIFIGLFCWGLVYVGQVMSSSNIAPEVNDQAIFYAAVTLPSWILTLVTYPMYALTETGRLSMRFDGALNLLCCLSYAACVTFCASNHWFVWWCPEDDYLEVVDTGECPDTEVLRNGGQNLAVIILGSVLALVYGLAAFSGLCARRSQPSPEEFTLGKPINDNAASENGNL